MSEDKEDIEEIIIKEETIPVIVDDKSIEIQNIISEGLFNVEQSLFSQSIFINKRVGRLGAIIDGLEERLLNAEDLSYLSPEEVLHLYKTYSKISKELLEYQIEIHKLVADMSKFESVKEMIGKTNDKVAKVESALKSPKIQKLLSLVDASIQEKTDESRRNTD